MKFNKKTIYGLLFCLYVDRAGRATVGEAAANLKAPLYFLQAIAGQLTKAGVLTSHRGPHGGFSLVNEEVTVLSVYKALNTPSDAKSALGRSGSMERRALSHFLGDAQEFFYHGLSIPIKGVNHTLVQKEIDSLHNDAAGQA